MSDVQPKPVKPALSIVRSFNERLYPASFVVSYAEDFAAIYNTPKADALYGNQSPYSDYAGDSSLTYRALKARLAPFENAQRMQLRHLDIVEKLKQINVTNYFLFESGYKIAVYFNCNKDMIMFAGVMTPDQTFEIDYLTYPDDVPEDYLQGIAEKIQNMYNKRGLKKAQLSNPVQLKADFAEHSVRILVKGVDIPRVMIHAENFQLMLNQ